VARPYSALRERVWDMAIEQLVARNLISQVNLVMTPAIAIAKVRVSTFLHP